MEFLCFQILTEILPVLQTAMTVKVRFEVLLHLQRYQLSIPTSSYFFTNLSSIISLYDKKSILQISCQGSPLSEKTWEIRRKCGKFEKSGKTWKIQWYFLENHSTLGKLWKTFSTTVQLVDTDWYLTLILPESYPCSVVAEI